MAQHGPPSDVSPSDLVTLLLAKPRPSKVVDFPSETLKGTKWERIRIIIPSAVEHGKAQLAAHKRMQEELRIPNSEWNTETGSAIIGDFVAKEMLARVVFSEEEIAPGKYARLFARSHDVEKCLSSDEVAVLHALFLQVQFELGPRLSVLSDTEVDAWIEVLKGGFDPLAYLVLPDLHVLIHGLVRRIAKVTASSDILPSPDSQPLTSLDTWESSPTNSATPTGSFGEPQSQPSTGLLDDVDSDPIIVDPISPEDAAAIARGMLGK